MIYRSDQNDGLTYESLDQFSFEANTTELVFIGIAYTCRKNPQTL